jgi:hypothetical protein
VSNPVVKIHWTTDSLTLYPQISAVAAYRGRDYRITVTMYDIDPMNHIHFANVAIEVNSNNDPRIPPSKLLWSFRTEDFISNTALTVNFENAVHKSAIQMVEQKIKEFEHFLGHPIEIESVIPMHTRSHGLSINWNPVIGKKDEHRAVYKNCTLHMFKAPSNNWICTIYITFRSNDRCVIFSGETQNEIEAAELMSDFIGALYIVK